MQSQYGQKTPLQTINRPTQRKTRREYRKDISSLTFFFLALRQWICIFISLGSQVVWLATRIVKWLNGMWLLMMLYKGFWSLISILAVFKGDYGYAAFFFFVYVWLPELIVWVGDLCHRFASWILEYAERKDAQYLA